MNKRNLSQLGLALLATSVAWLCPSAHAAWGSVRANNRSAREFRNAQPRVQAAAPVRQHGAETAVRGRAPELRGEQNRAEIRGGEEVRREPESRGREFISPRRDDFAREEREGRRFDFDADRRHLYFWSDYYPGYVINTLPPGYASIYAEGNPFYYYNGVFYEPQASGYVVVSPPLGAVVAQLPPGAEGIPIGPNIYYYAGGAFYLQQPQGFVVVAPPLGATVPELPPGATPVTINGMVYYQADGVYFMPVMQNGTTVYTVVQP